MRYQILENEGDKRARARNKNLYAKLGNAQTTYKLNDFKIKQFDNYSKLCKRVKMWYLRIMKTLTLTIPDNLDVNDRDLAMLVSTQLYEQGKLSLGQAAEVAGLTKRTFVELMGSYNVSIFNFPASDLSRDVSNA